MTDVADLRGHRGRQAILAEHVELLRELRAQIRIVGTHVAARRRAGNQLREARPRGAGAGRRVVVDGGLEEERRVQRKAKVGSGAFHELGDAVAAAEHQAIGRAVGGADPRFKALVVGLVERALFDASVLREDLPPGDEIEIRLPIVLLDERRRVGPAQPEIEREVSQDLEIVLHEERVAVLQMRPRIVRIAAAAALAGHHVEQEVRERKAGEGAVEIDESEQPVVAGIEALLVVVKELAAEFHRVTALHPGGLVVDLIGLRERVGVGGDGPRQREAAGPPNLAEAVDRLSAGNSVEGVGGSDTGPIERIHQ